MSLASKKLIQASGAADTGDDDFANVVLLLDGDGTSGDANNTFTDSSTNSFTVTENGSVVQGSFSPYGDNWSNYFDGSGDYLTFSDDVSLRLGTGDFTIEFWINQSSKSSYQTLVAKGYVSSGDYVVQTGNGDGNMVFAVSGTAIATESGSTVNVGEWYHIAIVRSGTTVTIYRNGVSVATGTSSANLSTTSSLNIGQASTYAVNGYLSNVRIVKGTAVYTSAFTPSTSPFTAITNTVLLTCQSNRFVDESTNNHTVTLNGTPKVTPFSPFKDDDARDITTDGGSGYFSGSDYLIKTSGVPTIGTSDFTVECWFYSNDASAGFRCLYDGREIAPDGVGIFQNGGDIEVWTSSKLIEQTVIRPNEWMHLALVRNSGSMQLYINGSASGSAVSFTTNCTSDERIIGENTANSGYYFKGYISDLRETHSAVYTSAFTPPTAPLTAIANTELLLNFQDAGIYDRSGINNIDTVGNAQIDTAVKKYGTGSLEFDGTGDYLVLTDDSTLSMGTGDFTVEFWSYCTATGYRIILDNNWDITTNSWQIYIYGEDAEILHANGGGSSISVGTGGNAVPNNQWTHLAFVKSGTNVKIYVNGTSSANGTMNVTFGRDSTNYIGIQAGSSLPFVGYLDDLRITKGVARYTSNFTPPDAALPKF